MALKKYTEKEIRYVPELKPLFRDSGDTLTILDILENESVPHDLAIKGFIELATHGGQQVLAQTLLFLFGGNHPLDTKAAMLRSFILMYTKGSLGSHNLDTAIKEIDSNLNFYFENPERMARILGMRSIAVGLRHTTDGAKGWFLAAIEYLSFIEVSRIKVLRFNLQKEVYKITQEGGLSTEPIRAGLEYIHSLQTNETVELTNSCGYKHTGTITGSTDSEIYIRFETEQVKIQKVAVGRIPVSESFGNDLILLQPRDWEI